MSVLAIFAINCNAIEYKTKTNNACSEYSFDHLLGSYKVVELARYGGGITSDKITNKWIGTTLDRPKEK